MKKLITYIAIDVDDNSYNFSILNSLSGELVSYKCAPNSISLVKKLSKILKTFKNVKICYESTYLGFSLCRSLISKGLSCEVIASSLIPELKGNKIKTDRVDSEKLVLFYSQGLLTPVKIPNEEQESIRDLIRTRSFLVSQAKAIKNHILSLCRRTGWDYKQEVDAKAPKHWNTKHRQWLKSKISNCESSELKFNADHLLKFLEQILERVEHYNFEIEQISRTPEYEKKVGALKCFKGIKTTIAMTLVTEIGDINRFKHPSQLTSYCGLDIIEYSSGGKERKFNISKMGNPFIRTNIVEACQMATRPPNISRRLKEDRFGQNEKVIQIADKCMKRLYKKGNRLKYKDKAANKIKVACGREMLGFIWETLKYVS